MDSSPRCKCTWTKLSPAQHLQQHIKVQCDEWYCSSHELSVFFVRRLLFSSPLMLGFPRDKFGQGIWATVIYITSEHTFSETLRVLPCSSNSLLPKCSQGHCSLYLEPRIRKYEEQTNSSSPKYITRVRNNDLFLKSAVMLKLSPPQSWLT